MTRKLVLQSHQNFPFLILKDKINDVLTWYRGLPDVVSSKVSFLIELRELVAEKRERNIK